MRGFSRHEDVKAWFDVNFDEYDMRITARSMTFSVPKKLRVVLIEESERLSFSALGLIGRMRKEALERMKDIEVVDAPCRNVFGFYRYDSCRSGYEYDLRQAYPRELLSIGAISRRTFDSMSKLRKSERLIVCGALASVAYIKKVRCGQVVETKTEIQETAPIWNTVVTRVNSRMRFFAEALNAYFFWVDALFLSGRERSLNSFEWKEGQCSWIFNAALPAYVFADGRKFFVQSTKKRA
jgi:hypothetical protein